VRKQGEFVQTVKAQNPDKATFGERELGNPSRAGGRFLTHRGPYACREAVRERGCVPVFTTTVKRTVIAIKPRHSDLIEVAVDEG